MTRALFRTPAIGVGINPTGNYQMLAQVDVSTFTEIRVFADNDQQANHVLIHLVMLEENLSLALDVLLIRGAVQVTNTYGAHGTTLKIEAAVVGPIASVIHVVVYGIP
jgi:hypothetical protein